MSGTPAGSSDRRERLRERLRGDLRVGPVRGGAGLSLLPALLSWSRIAGAPALVVAAWLLESPRAAFWIVLGCSLSDYMDGRLARATGSASHAGRVLDFTADKFFLPVALMVTSLTMGVLEPVAAVLLASYHLVLLLALAAVSWSLSSPLVTITTGEKLAVLFSYLLVTVAAGQAAFPEKYLFHSLLWPTTVIALLSALMGLVSYMRLMRRVLGGIVGR